MVTKKGERRNRAERLLNEILKTPKGFQKDDY